jgi:hypothetical protein
MMKEINAPTGLSAEFKPMSVPIHATVAAVVVEAFFPPHRSARAIKNG